MEKFIDLTHTITQSIATHNLDEPIKLEKIRTLSQDNYNDWRLCSGMHVGTHIDGPEHLTNSLTELSSVPIESFIGKGCIIDARNKAIIALLLKNISLEKDSIVLILTNWDKKFGKPEYFANHPIIQDDFAQILIKSKIKMLGIDFFSPDTYPFPVHKKLFAHNIFIAENLTNLEKLLDIPNFTIIALPFKVATDSAPARVIALTDFS